MSAQPKLNIASIIGIKDGIHQVFALMDQNLEVYRNHPDNDKFIRDCRNYIHQLDGLLEMLNLKSITVVTEKMEQLVDALIFKKIEPNPAIFDALKLSTKALLFYLNELIDGAEENPLRLFPAYRELMQVYGYQNAPESDLFFPRPTGNPALKSEATHIDAAAAKLLAKKLAADFQAGLLKWLRNPSNQSGLQQMAAAVGAIEEFPGTAEQRSFWWVTGGFLESLMSLEAEQIDLPVRRLCGKIEQTIRHLAAGTASETSVLLRELLYHISQSESAGQRINDIRQCYVWPGQNSRDDGRTFEETESLNPILERLRSTLMQTNDIWREFCAGQESSLPSLLEYIDWLEHQAKQTDCAPLVKLIDAIGNTVAYLHAQPQDMNEELAMEMATALLLIESIIDDFDKLSPDLPRQVDVLTSRLIGITAGDISINELPASPTFNTIASKTQEVDIQSHVAQEILANLNQIESILDKFFFEPSKRSELSLLPEFFKQISGALIMLNLERANTLLNHCQNLVNKLLDPQYQIVEPEQILLVDGLSSLSFFIEASKSGQPDSYHIIEEALALFRIKPILTSSPQPAEKLEAAPTIAADTATAQPQATQKNPELLAIFLEEAEEVLAEIAHELQQCRADASNDDALRNLRRGFHTLKGSGRMVKLEEISDIAWKVEQVLNAWLQASKPASAAFLDFISHAHQAYSGWCQDLRRQDTAQVDADALLLEAQALLAELTTPQPLPAETQAPVAHPAAAKQTVNDSTEVQPEQTPASPAPAAVEALVPAKPPVTESLNPELIQVFLEETQESVPQIGGKLRAWRMLPQDEDIHRAMLRLLHTLKGSARMAGALHLGELIHAMESHVESAFRERNISDTALDQLESQFDAICDQIEQLHSHEMGTAAVKQQLEPVVISEPVQPPAEKAEALHSKTIVRINSGLIDRLVNDSGEASILRSKIEAQLQSFKQSLQDLAESTHRLHDQLREVEIQAETQMQTHLAQQQDNEPSSFDPLEFDRFTRFQELTRMMAESVDDIITAQKSLRSTHTVAEEAVAQQASVNRQLQQSLLQIRTIPFSNYAERYYRIARQVAEDMDKKAQLDIQGLDVEIDRNILEKINPPLEHMLRNAIAHGIETPVERKQAGKPETGQVSVQLRQESNEVIITVSDDGRGLDLPRIRTEAQRLGFIQQDEVLDEDKIISLIFKQGLSTTDTVSDIAGRGIGLDVVKNEISLLGGRISINSVPGQGTAFTIHLPLSLSVTQTFMVKTGKQNYAIPAFIVEHHRQFDPDTLNRIYQSHSIEFNGKKYGFAHLSHLLGEPSANPAANQSGPVLFLHSGTQHLAIQIDELIGDREIVAKSIGDQLAQAPGVEGATITADGEVILVLNPVKLMQRSDVQQVFSTPVSVSAAAHQNPVKTPTVLVVDDSLTVRKVTCRLLEREGCDVLIAKNGAEAISILKETIPDAMLIDLEMPKMNGFELIKKVRSSPQTAAIPIIIISSRTAEKHQKIAQDLGVNVFLGKPYKEEELLGHLASFVAR